MRVVDRLFRVLSGLGSTYAAGVAGGGIMFIVDALKKNDKFRLEFFHHEQSAAFAAEAFARSTSTLPVCFATIGPGVTNVVSGAFSCFLNSVPCFFVTGAKRSNVSTDYLRQRFTFPQDGNTSEIAKGVVKKFYELKADDDVEQVVFDLATTALSGRPGPVWLSVPLDIQAAVQSEEVIPKNSATTVSDLHEKPIREQQAKILQSLSVALQTSQKPLIIVGHGVERVSCSPEFVRFLQETRVPVVTSIGGNHLISAAATTSVGVFGPTGRRAANRVLLEADLLVGLGFRFTPDTIGFDSNAFFRSRPVIAVTDDPDFALPQGVGGSTFCIQPDYIPLAEMTEVIQRKNIELSKWLTYVQNVSSVLTQDLEISLSRSEQKVDPYFFADEFLKNLNDGVAIAGGISLEIVALSNSTSFKKGHKFFVSSHAGQLGWDLPAAIGLAHSGMYDAVICFTGDGSLMFNLQEMATLGRVECGATIVVFDNDGYNSIKTTQETHLNRLYAGSTLDDLAFPDWHHLAKAFGFDWHLVSSNHDVQSFFSNWEQGSKNLVQVKIDQDRGRTPRIVSKISDGRFVTPSLDEQFPSLPAEVIRALSLMKARLEND